MTYGIPVNTIMPMNMSTGKLDISNHYQWYQTRLLHDTNIEKSSTKTTTTLVLQQSGPSASAAASTSQVRVAGDLMVNDDNSIINDLLRHMIDQQQPRPRRTFNMLTFNVRGVAIKHLTAERRR